MALLLHIIFVCVLIIGVLAVALLVLAAQYSRLRRALGDEAFLISTIQTQDIKKAAEDDWLL